MSIGEELIQAEFDGGSRGNPGPAGIGIVLRAEDGTPLLTLGRFIGKATNNVAEYRALITAMEQARLLGVCRLVIRGDSELVVKQMRGEYRVKNADLRTLHERARELAQQFASCRIEHRMRAGNRLADQLANAAMDARRDVDEVPAEAGAAAEEARQPGGRLACPRCGCTIEVVRRSGLDPRRLQPFICPCGAGMIRCS